MSANTKIEWADMTWNPIIGCSMISDGCEFCYARIMAIRLANMGHEGYSEVIDSDHEWSGRMYFRKGELKKVAAWKKPRRIFVSSMGDFFHPNAPDEWRDIVFDTIKDTPHTYIFLTKRPENAARYLKPKHLGPRIWIGVTAEHQRVAHERVPTLLQIPAAVKFVSLEPMLGSIDLTRLIHWPTGAINALSGQYVDADGEKSWPRLDWVICGGETGTNGRRFEESWASSIRDQCSTYGVPFFFKKKGIYWCRKHDFHPSGPENRKVDGSFYEGFPTSTPQQGD